MQCANECGRASAASATRLSCDATRSVKLDIECNYKSVAVTRVCVAGEVKLVVVVERYCAMLK